MQRPIPLIVFSDLDGTLLDHDSYSWAPAQPALARLAALKVPVVLATSKTEEEVVVLQHQMGLSGYPAIVENGAGLVGLHPVDVSQTSNYQRLRSILEQLSPALRGAFTGFGDMTAKEVAGTTGLSLQDAHRAKSRAYSEPGLWSGTPEERAAFIAELGTYGVTARVGGRFLTLSFGKTKRDRMAEIMAHVGATHSIALGDAPNDVEMLEAADTGVIIANPYTRPLPVLNGEKSGSITRTQDPGPTGWNAAINAFLDAHELIAKDYKVG